VKLSIQKSLLIFVAIVITGFVSVSISNAQENQEEQKNIYVFVRDDCGHCVDEKAFIADLENERDDIVPVYYDLAEQKNTDLFNEVAENFEIVKGTPISLINGVIIQGFDKPETTGDLLTDLLDRNTFYNVSFEESLERDDIVVAASTQGSVCLSRIGEECAIEDNSQIITVPIIGSQIDVGSWSLGTLSLVLGFVDGFNPCALWVLIMFITVLLQVSDKRRMWQYVTLFLIAEAVMYYLILNVWLTTWNFVGLNSIVMPIVGLLALGSGGYFAYKFFTYSPVCKVASFDTQKKLSDKIKAVAAKPMSIATALGVLFIAFSVNIFEFACSIGIPQVFAKIIEVNDLSFLMTQWYMLLYMFAYMIDDLIIFGIALYSVEKIGDLYKYSKWTTLIAAILMIALGLIILFKPELLIVG